MKKIIRPIYHIIKALWRINILKTIYVNFKMLPFSQAVKMPICIYGKMNIHSLCCGKFIIDSPEIYVNMIKIGYKWIDLWPISQVPSQFTVYFHGPVIIGGGTEFFIQDKDASIELGKYVIVCSGCVLKSMDVLKIGDYSRIVGGCIIMNSNMHYIKNIETGKVAKPYGKIEIGHHCWVNANSVVTKGAVIPNYSITARNSFINKDFSEYGENLFLAGAPSTVKGSKVQRIFSTSITDKLTEFFKQHPKEEVYQDELGITPDIDNIECF